MDDGKVHVFANKRHGGADQAFADDPRRHGIRRNRQDYLGKVVRLAEFGAFVEIFPGTDGLLHISEIGRTAHPRRSGTN